MATFNFEDYERQQAARRANSNPNGVKGNNVNFINSFLKNDGDTVTVRFPYKSMKDISYESTHSVKFPNEKFNKRVRCEGENCPLCQSGVKTDFRFFVKGLVYQVDDDGKMTVIPAIWDRAAAFADIDIKNKMQQCADDDIGTLDENLIKIRKTGSGLETRYTLDIIAPTNKIYNSRTCPADFSLLENIDPAKILTKSFDQYKTALNGGVKEAAVEETKAPAKETTYEAPVQKEPKVEAEEEMPKRPVRFAF